MSSPSPFLIEARDTDAVGVANYRNTPPVTPIFFPQVCRVAILICKQVTIQDRDKLPQFLFNAGFCRDGKIIGITQPRRIAAVSVAKRVAEKCGVELGQKVGYSVRFDDMTSSSTRIKYMTDGFLLRNVYLLKLSHVALFACILMNAEYVHKDALLEPYLSRYAVIIVHQAHERTVHTDVLLGLLKSVQNVMSGSVNQCPNIDHTKANNGPMMEKENDAKSTGILKQYQGTKFSPLKLIIMSASLDAQIFSEYFGSAKAIHVKGRQFPVDILYTYHLETDCIDAALITIFQIHLEEGPGDILVFLTGQEEIEESLRLLPKDNKKLKVLPIFSSLPSEKQMQVFMPAPIEFHKVILATNIAETSVTISRIKYVIDPGLVKARTYCARTGMKSLIFVRTSKAQALQRSGRAGREEPGKCFHLYPEIEFEKLRDSTIPEITRCNLSNVILQLKALGVDDIIGFDFMEKPSRDAVIKSLEILVLLDAITEEYTLSDPVGHQMARLLLKPIHSKALILASQLSFLEEMLITVAMLSVESIFYAPREKLEEAQTATKCFSSLEGDHLILINIYRTFDEFLEKSKIGINKEQAEKSLRKWCKENFINSRSLRHAREIHRQIQRNVEQMGLSMTSCGEEMLQYRRCLTAACFLNAALKQPDGTYSK
ncbi:hypothetical protein ACSBR2_003717 [Camellia fascicularis]